MGAPPRINRCNATKHSGKNHMSKLGITISIIHCHRALANLCSFAGVMLSALAVC
jgi:hypothetical protein